MNHDFVCDVPGFGTRDFGPDVVPGIGRRGYVFRAGGTGNVLEFGAVRGALPLVGQGHRGRSPDAGINRQLLARLGRAVHIGIAGGQRQAGYFQLHGQLDPLAGGCCREHGGGVLGGNVVEAFCLVPLVTGCAFVDSVIDAELVLFADDHAPVNLALGVGGQRAHLRSIPGAGGVVVDPGDVADVGNWYTCGIHHGGFHEGLVLQDEVHIGPGNSGGDSGGGVGVRRGRPGPVLLEVKPLTGLVADADVGLVGRNFGQREVAVGVRLGAADLAAIAG